MEKRRILIVEDDEAIREGLVDALSGEGYEVFDAADGESGLALGLREDPDLILLDLRLPKLDGFDVLRRLREDGVETPVLVLTARGREEDKVRGLSLGADDYVVKPFGLPELFARIASRLRTWDRERGLSERRRLHLPDATIDFAAREIRRGSEAHPLTPKEFELLRYLLGREGETATRAEILDAVWTGSPEVVSRVIDTTVLTLRKKLEIDPANPRHLLSVRGVGYRFARKP